LVNIQEEKKGKLSIAVNKSFAVIKRGPSDVDKFIHSILPIDVLVNLDGRHDFGEKQANPYMEDVFLSQDVSKLLLINYVKS
jgi:hypothetical protein